MPTIAKPFSTIASFFAEAVTANAATPLISLRQFHSNRIVQAAGADAARKQPHKADGQITDEPGFLLAIQTADCIPVLVADRKQRVVAAFHAGWRGTVKRIVESGVGRMRLAFGSHPEDLIAAIGPGIGLCCYAVGEEVLSEFESQFSYARELFREVYDSDPVRKKYPMLFLTQRAPGHSAIGPSLHVDLDRSQPPPASRRRSRTRIHPGRRRLHAVPRRSLLFPSRLARPRRPHDGRHWHSRTAETPHPLKRSDRCQINLRIERGIRSAAHEVPERNLSRIECAGKPHEVSGHDFSRAESNFM